MTKLSSGTNALVHPLVIMQMSEHYSRNKVQESPAINKVFGAILGKQTGREYEAINTFTFKMYVEDESNGMSTFNQEHFIARVGQYAEVFPELQVIGAYSSGEDDEMTLEEKNLLTKLVCELRSDEKNAHSPLFLKLNAIEAGSARKLPLYAFEGDLADIEKYKTIEWVLVSENSERIGVNHIAKFSTKDGKDEGSASVKHIKGQQAALSMCESRVELIVAYLEKVHSGELQPNFEILQEANILAQKLNTIDNYSEDFKNEFDEENKNIAMFSLLPKLTTLLGNAYKTYSKVAISRAESMASDEFKPQSSMRWGYPFKGNRFKGDRSMHIPGDAQNDDEFLDDEEFESEMGGPKRKIHAADPSASGSRRRRGGLRRSEAARAARSRAQQLNDHDMEMDGYDDEDEDTTDAPVPDAPRMPQSSKNPDDFDEAQNIDTA